VDGCQSWKLALETSANFVPARVSGKCVMGIKAIYLKSDEAKCVLWDRNMPKEYSLWQCVMHSNIL